MIALPVLFLMLFVDRPGPEEIPALLVGRVVEYDSETRTDADRERQEWFADGTTRLTNMGLFAGDQIREWRVIGTTYCSNVPGDIGNDCYHVATWDEGRVIRFTPVGLTLSDRIFGVFTVERIYTGRFVD